MSDQTSIYRPLEGRQTTPRTHVTCGCGRQMIVRENGQTGERFLGCEGFASGLCNGTRKLPEYLKLREAGATELPGMADL